MDAVERIKRNARRRIAHAVRIGRLVRPQACPRCGRGDKRIEAHHPNGYDEGHVYDVVWLCSQCHANEHRIYIDDPIVIFDRNKGEKDG